jgi:PRTRC genetic system ThiF family protein
MKRVHYTDKYLLNPSHPVTVNLIGVGGTGSQVLTALARIDHALYKLGHPGLHVRAYDPDIVAESNLGRQLFSESDLGVNKADVFVTRVNRFFGLSWEAIPEKAQLNDSICHELANITITCVDTLQSRIDLYQALNESNTHQSTENRPIYWMDFGNTQKTGQVVLGSIRQIKQPNIQDVETVSTLKTIGELHDLSNVKDKDSGPSCSLAEALTKQDLFINSTLAQIGCAILWKLLSSGSIDHHGAYLNLESMNVNAIKV